MNDVISANDIMPLIALLYNKGQKIDGQEIQIRRLESEKEALLMDNRRLNIENTELVALLADANDTITKLTGELEQRVKTEARI